jgi:hypothetical protein
MVGPWVEVFGVPVAAPVSVGTNLVLAVECAWCFWCLRRAPDARVGQWSLFFLAMAVATLAGAPKHGLREVLGPRALALVLWTSSLGSGLAVRWAQHATLPAWQGGSRRGIQRVSDAQLLTYLAANVALGPLAGLFVVNTAVGLLPVTFVEAFGARRGVVGAADIAAGLGLGMVTALVYVAGLSYGPWLTHVDIAHLLMGVSYYLIFRGARARVWPPILATRHGEVYL